MTIAPEKLCEHMAVAVSGLDLNRPADTATQSALRDALNRNLVLCIRGQKLAPLAFRDAMARFGTPMKRLQLAHTEECAEVNIISSEDRDVLGDGKKIVNGASWHTDDSFMREPCSLTMLHGVVVPSRGGDTQFVNMHAAYEALSPGMKARIDGLQVIHKYQSSRQTNKVSKRPEAEMKAMPEATHPLVRTHPETQSALPQRQSHGADCGHGSRGKRRAARHVDCPRHRAALPVPPCLAAGRHRDLGQSFHDAQGQRRLSRRRAPADAPRDRGGQRAVLILGRY